MIIIEVRAYEDEKKKEKTIDKIEFVSADRESAMDLFYKFEGLMKGLAGRRDRADQDSAHLG